MFEILKYDTIEQRSGQYLSFPDIIQSKKNKERFFLVYRSGDNHHPSYSCLHFLESTDSCKSWQETHSFSMNMRDDGKVWNCPRLSYLPNGDLYIICDSKTSKDEYSAKFRVHFIISSNDGKTFNRPSSVLNNYMGIIPTNLSTSDEDYIRETEIYGMVPDKIVKFKDKLYCANHLRDKEKRTLTQLVNCSKDEGKTWYDCSIIARSPGEYAFCEASIINHKDKCLIAYLRDNYKSPKRMHKFISKDGVNWQSKGELPIHGHRATAQLFDSKLLMTYRNTKEPGIYLLSAKLDQHGKERDIKTFEIDKDSHKNLFHCGYTGLARIRRDTYCVAYYIKRNQPMPYIKTCIFKHS